MLRLFDAYKIRDRFEPVSEISELCSIFFDFNKSTHHLYGLVEIPPDEIYNYNYGLPRSF